MNKLIANGILKDEDGYKVVATVYVKLDADGKESTTAGDTLVYINYTQTDATTAPIEAVTYEDIITALEDAEGNVGDVPGYDGHDDVALTTPVKMNYSKTKTSVNRDGKINVFTKIKYNF